LRHFILLWHVGVGLEIPIGNFLVVGEAIAFYLRGGVVLNSGTGKEEEEVGGVRAALRATF